MFPETHQNCTLSVGYSLGMVKMEAFDDSHLFLQAVTRCFHLKLCVCLCVPVCVPVPMCLQ